MPAPPLPSAPGTTLHFAALHSANVPATTGSRCEHHGHIHDQDHAQGNFNTRSKATQPCTGWVICCSTPFVICHPLNRWMDSCSRFANCLTVAEAESTQATPAHRGRGSACADASPLRVPLHPFALPAVACACGFGCTSRLSCLVPPPKNATVLTQLCMSETAA